MLLDGMVGYDPEDPVDGARRRQASDGSYTKSLDANALKGARIGILRESIGNESDPDSEDFKKVDAAFEKNVAELKAAGAVVVDPIVIPDLKELLRHARAQPGRGRRGAASSISRAIRTRRSRRARTSASRPTSTRASRRPRSTAGESPPPPFDPARYVEYPAGARATDGQHPQGDGRQQARRHRAQDPWSISRR